MVLPSSGNPRRKHGPLVKWLRQRPLTPLTSVRIRYGSPFLKRLDNLIKVCYCTKAVTIQQLVLIRARVHPFPSRTRKLSSLLPTILGWRRPGKIGSANTKKRHSNKCLFFVSAQPVKRTALKRIAHRHGNTENRSNYGICADINAACCAAIRKCRCYEKSSNCG